MRKSDNHRLAKIFKKAQAIRRQERQEEIERLSKPSKTRKLQLSIQLANMT